MSKAVTVSYSLPAWVKEIVEQEAPKHSLNGSKSDYVANAIVQRYERDKAMAQKEAAVEARR